MFKRSMESIGRVVVFFLLVLSCSFFCVQDVEASGTGYWVNTTGRFISFNLSYPSSGSSVTGTLSTNGTSNGTVSNSGSISNYVGYFNTGATLNTLVSTTSGLSFRSFSALYTNERVNGSTSPTFWSGTLYHCTGTTSTGTVVDCVTDGSSLMSRVYEFSSVQVGSSAASSSSSANKDSGTFSGTINSSDYAVSQVFCAFTIDDLTAYMEYGKEYYFSFVIYFPQGMSCNGLIAVPVAVSDYGADFDGTAVITSDGYIYCSGTLVPYEFKQLFIFGFNFYMPSGVSLSGTSLAATSAMYSIKPASSTVVSDAVTRFSGSAALDTSKGQLDGVISDYDKIEGSLFDSGQAAFDKFDPSTFPNFTVGVASAVGYISQLMVGIISAMGEFSVLYTVGMFMVFFGVLVGLWRFFK